MIELDEPDGVRAWVVAIAACMINMILSGLSRMVSMLYVEIIDIYDVSRAEAVLPFTIRNSVRSLAGPLVGLMGEHFSILTVTFLGGVVAATGAALCSVAPNASYLAAFWGGVHGLGFCMANTLFQPLVNQYFQKYRTMASGIALSGACVGSQLFPFMIEYMLRYYALSGTFLLLSGVVLNVLPFSLLLRSPQWVEHPAAYAKLWALKYGTTSTDTINTTVVELSRSESIDSRFAASTSLSNCPVESTKVFQANRYNLQKERETGVFGKVEGYSKKPSESKVINISYRTMETNSKSVYVQKQGSQVLTTPEDESCPLIPTGRYTSGKSLRGSIETIRSLFANPLYILISVSMTTYVFLFIPILTVVVDYSKDKGIPQSVGKYLINVMAVGDLVGRLSFGYVIDKRIITAKNFLILAFVLQGVFVALFPLATTETAFMILLFLYSNASGSILILFPILVFQYTDIRSQSLGISCSSFMSGILSFGIPSLIGYFRDTAGSYDNMFYILGAFSVISGVLWTAEPLMVKFNYRRIKTNLRTQDDESRT